MSQEHCGWMSGVGISRTVAPRMARSVVLTRRQTAAVVALACLPLPLLSLVATFTPIPASVERSVARFLPLVSPTVAAEPGPAGSDLFIRAVRTQRRPQPAAAPRSSPTSRRDRSSTRRPATRKPRVTAEPTPAAAPAPVADAPPAPAEVEAATAATAPAASTAVAPAPVKRVPEKAKADKARPADGRSGNGRSEAKAPHPAPAPTSEGHGGAPGEHSGGGNGNANGAGKGGHERP